MSYEIIKNIRVEKNKDNSGWHIVGTSACNNLYPHYYSEWTSGEGKNLSKEYCEKALLYDFWVGNFQGGSSRYLKTCKDIDKAEHRHLLNRYYRLGEVIDKTQHRVWNDNSLSEQRRQELIKVNSKLRDMQQEEIKEVLHNFMYIHAKERNQTKVAPFTIMDKWEMRYVTKVTKTRYYVSDRPVAHTSKALYDKVMNSEWWKEYFVIEQVAQ